MSSNNEVEFIPAAKAAAHPKKRQRKNADDPNAQATNMIFTLWSDKTYGSGLRSLDTFMEQLSNKVEDGTIVYAALGPEETCPDTMRKHRHGMILLSTAKRFKQVQNWFALSDSASADPKDCALWWLRMEGTPQQAFDYLSKESSIHNPNGFAGADGKIYLPGTQEVTALELGSRPESFVGKGQMEKDRHAEAIRLAKLGKFDEISPDIFLARYATILALHQKEHDRSYLPAKLPDSRWYYGASYSGKSFACITELPSDEARAKVYHKVAGANKWFSGFDPTWHDTVLWDDINPSPQLDFSMIKQLTGPYPVTLEVKGGSVRARPPKVVFTSNFHPSMVFTQNEDYLAMRSRLKVRYYPIRYEIWAAHNTGIPNYYLEFPVGEFPCHQAIVDMLPDNVKKLCRLQELHDQKATAETFVVPPPFRGLPPPIEDRPGTPHPSGSENLTALASIALNPVDPFQKHTQELL